VNKKNQKNFADLAGGVATSVVQMNKVFLLLFVHKKKYLLPFFMLAA